MDRSGEALGVGRQLEDCRELAARKGWTLVEEYVDNDVSAYSTKPRPQYVRMLKAIRDGAIDGVVVWDEDRLTRRPIEIEEFIELADDYRFELASVAGDIDISTESGRLHLRIKAAVARDEVEKKARRQRRQRQQAAEDGRQCGGPRAFGYTADGLHLDPDESPLLIEAYRRFVGGESLGSIARWLTSVGTTTPRGMPWRYQSVRTVLANPRNAGLRGVRQLLPGRAGRNGRRETWHTIVGDAGWPAVVDRDTWSVVMTTLKDPQRSEGHVDNRQRYLLSGIAECGVCGSPLVTGRRDGVRLLKCPTLRHVSRKAEPVEELSVAVLMARCADPAALSVMGLRRSDKRGPDFAALKGRADDLKRRKKQLLDNYREGTFEWEDVQRTGKAFDAELREIDRTLASASRADHAYEIIGVDDPKAVWDEWPLAIKREVIASRLVVTVLPGTPGRKPFDPRSVDVKVRKLDED